MTTKTIPAGQLAHGHVGKLLTIEGTKDTTGQSITLQLDTVSHSSRGTSVTGSCLGEYLSRDLDARKLVILTSAPEASAPDFTPGA